LPAEAYGTWDYDELKEALLSGLPADYLGLWQIAALLRHAGLTSFVERRRAGLLLVRDLLLNHHLVAGSLGENGTFDPWPLEPDKALARIEEEWLARHDDPNINDICWFDRPR
jgi:hypothetical protein